MSLHTYIYTFEHTFIINIFFTITVSANWCIIKLIIMKKKYKFVNKNTVRSALLQEWYRNVKHNIWHCLWIYYVFKYVSLKWIKTQEKAFFMWNTNTIHIVYAIYSVEVWHMSRTYIYTDGLTDHMFNWFNKFDIWLIF